MGDPRSPGPAPEERITVLVRSRAGDDELAEAFDRIAKRLPHERTLLTPEEHERRFGSSPQDLQAVQDFAARHGLRTVEASAARRAVELAGPPAALRQAFGEPRELSGVIEDVLGLDDPPLPPPSAAVPAEGGAITKLVHTDPRTLARHYGFPPDATGRGQRVALVHFGGGFYPEDMEAYFRLRGLRVPAMELVELEGQTNRPAGRRTMLSCAARLGLLDPAQAALADPDTPQDFRAFFATLECTMDLQILGTIAPDSRFVTYLAPDSARGKYAAFSKAIFDPRHAASVINCSWGSRENRISASSMHSLDRLFLHAALRGVTICASAGDFGEQPTGHFPASSPCVLACGGSSVAPDLSRETAWSETLCGLEMSGGGGFSEVFELPWWQKRAGLSRTGRAFPDVAAKADIMTGYDVVVAGLDLPMGGTSAATPMWAGLIALLNEKLGRPVGFLNSLLYAERFADAVGNRGCWDPHTGLGSPMGPELLKALSPD